MTRNVAGSNVYAKNAALRHFSFAQDARLRGHDITLYAGFASWGLSRRQGESS